MTGIIKRIELGSDQSFKPSANPHSAPPPPIPAHVFSDEVDNIDYRFEAARLQSFENWPVPYIEPKKLAAAGFYYTGEDDKVRCFECHIEIRQWVEGDNPMVDHQRWSARCRFIRKIHCGNVPIGVDPSNVLPPRPRSWDVCGLYGVKYQPTSGPDNHNFTAELQLPSTAKLSCLGLGRPKRSVHSEYASYDARLRTFETWPMFMPQTKQQLADAGFYYTGKGDQTLCYHCGGGLKDWESEDDPWEQHAKWFSNCYYLLMVKGQDYVNRITGQHVSPPSKEVNSKTEVVCYFYKVNESICSCTPHLFQETMRMNLPSLIKKVEPVAMETEGKAEAKCNPGPSSESKESNNNGLVNEIGSNAASMKGRMEDVTNTGTQYNKPIDDARMCKICYNGELGVVFLPCGHIVACVKCAPDMTTCAVCRGPVTMTVRAFFS